MLALPADTLNPAAHFKWIWQKFLTSKQNRRFERPKFVETSRRRKRRKNRLETSLRRGFKSFTRCHGTGGGPAVPRPGPNGIVTRASCAALHSSTSTCSHPVSKAAGARARSAVVRASLHSVDAVVVTASTRRQSDRRWMEGRATGGGWRGAARPLPCGTAGILLSNRSGPGSLVAARRVGSGRAGPHMDAGPRWTGLLGCDTSGWVGPGRAN